MPTFPSPREGNAQATMDWLTSPMIWVHDHFTCPQGHLLLPAYRMDQTQEVQYRADAAICNACPVKEACTESKRGRHVHRSFFADYLDRVKAYGQTLAYHKARNLRKVWIEPLFGEGKQWHGMRRFRLRRHRPSQLRSLGDCLWTESQTPPAEARVGETSVSD
jgi:hypothetical protein